MSDFDPTEATVAEVNEYLEEADPAEVDRVLQAEEAADTPRKGIVEGPYAAANAGEERTDASGRVLHAWEVDPEAQATPATPSDQE